MIKIAFVCHGNICRSPMAEFIFKDKIKKLGLEKEFHVRSFGTSPEELCNPVYPPVREILRSRGIDCSNKRAEVLSPSDYDKFDYFICMDERNVRNIGRIFIEDDKKKIFKLLDFTNKKGDVADPYYYGGFSKVEEDIERGVNSFIEFLSGKS